MLLVRAEHMTISLCHLILAEDSTREPEPRTLPAGVLRLTLEAGRVLDLVGAAAENVRRQLDLVAIQPDEPAPRQPQVGKQVQIQEPPESSGPVLGRPPA